MNIICTQYTMSRRSLDFFVAGCKAPHCKGCCNPETWKFDQGIDWVEYFLKIVQPKVELFNHMIDKFTIYGGEPLDSDHMELEDFLVTLKKMDKEIWLFTRYEYCDIPEDIRLLCDYIKCGPYDENQKTNHYYMYGVNLASQNQRIYKMR